MVEITDFNILIEGEANKATDGERYIAKVRSNNFSVTEPEPNPVSILIKKGNKLRSNLFERLMAFRGIYSTMDSGKDEFLNQNLSGTIENLTKVLNTYIGIDASAEDLCTEKYRQYKEYIFPIKEQVEELISEIYKCIRLAKKLNAKIPMQHSQLIEESANHSRHNLQTIIDGRRAR